MSCEQQSDSTAESYMRSVLVYDCKSWCILKPCSLLTNSTCLFDTAWPGHVLASHQAVTAWKSGSRNKIGICKDQLSIPSLVVCYTHCVMHHATYPTKVCHESPCKQGFSSMPFCLAKWARPCKKTKCIMWSVTACSIGFEQHKCTPFLMCMHCWCFKVPCSPESTHLLQGNNLDTDSVCFEKIVRLALLHHCLYQGPEGYNLPCVARTNDQVHVTQPCFSWLHLQWSEAFKDLIN